MQVNKEGADWKVLKAKLNTMIDGLQEDMLNLLPPEEYHRCRGGILLAREVIEWVEPTTPPITEEDNYGISDPNKDNFV